MSTVKPGQVWEDVRTGALRRQVEVERVECGYAYVVEPSAVRRSRIRVDAFMNYRLAQDSDGTPPLHPMAEAVEAPEMLPYLTIISNRSPKQKAHTDLGQAKKAVLFRLEGRDSLTNIDCRVYAWTATGWKLMWLIPEGTSRKEMPWLLHSPKV